MFSIADCVKLPELTHEMLTPFNYVSGSSHFSFIFTYWTTCTSSLGDHKNIMFNTKFLFSQTVSIHCILTAQNEFALLDSISVLLWRNTSVSFEWVLVRPGVLPSLSAEGKGIFGDYKRLSLPDHFFYHHVWFKNEYMAKIIDNWIISLWFWKL